MSKQKEILREKILNRADQNKTKIFQIIDSLQKDDAILNDSLVSSDEFKFFTKGDNLRVQYGDKDASLGKFATKQMANRFGVPTNYINKLNDKKWGRELAAEIFNEHGKNNEAQRFLVRNINNQIRGVLSDSYKRMNSLQIYKAFLQAAANCEAKIYDAAIDETKSFISVVKPEIIEIETPNNGIVDIVFGAEIRNSDFGDGSLNVRTFMNNVVCLNGMIGTKFLNEIHRGVKLPDNIELSERTYQAETTASASLVTDAMKHIFNAENIDREVKRINSASEQEIDFDNKIKQLKRTKHYSDFELKTLANKLTVSNPDDGVTGKNTLWKFVQGLTSVANEYNTTRKNELIEYASDLY